MISIIIPCYNGEKYIVDTIQSCLEQTYQNFEIIIIDDGSTDSSVDVIEEISKQSSKVKLYRQKNKGSCYARNHGIEVSTGELLFFLDADDILMPDALTLLLNGIEGNDACYADVLKMDEECKLTEVRKRYYPKIPFLSVINEAPFCGSVLIRKKSLKTWWDNKYDAIDEFYFFAKNAALGVKFKKIENYVLKYRQHESIHRKSNNSQIKSNLTNSITAAYIEFSEITTNGVDDKYKRHFYCIVFFILFHVNIKSGNIKIAKKIINKITIYSLLKAIFIFMLIGFFPLKKYGISMATLVNFYMSQKNRT